MRKPARRIPAVPAVVSLTLVLLAVTGPAVTESQELHGKFLEVGSGEPVEGALVRLVDPSDSTLATSVTDAGGTSRLDAGRAGRYRVVVKRIGFESWTSDPFELTSGAVERRVFPITVRPVELAGLSVDVADERRCRIDPTTGRATARLWEEIRKALERERLTRAGRRITYQVREYRRQLDGRLRITSEQASTSTTAARSPYRAVSVEELTAEGFVDRDAAGGWLYRAPDADVLLSARFQQTHCFGISEDEDGGRIGLTFRPVEDHRQPEIEGTLWVDAATGALQEVAYHYVNLNLPVPDSVARGRVAFARAPTGDWYVERWWIRWPRKVEESELRRQGVDATGVDQVGRDRRVIEYGEVGATVSSLVARGEDVEPRGGGPVGRGTVTGTAYDSLSGGPAAGVEVSIGGTGRRARTDRDGHFVFRSVPEGRYRVSFTHPAVPALPDSLTAVTMEVEANWTAEARLATPGPQRLYALVCGEEPGGLVVGRVLAARGEGPVPAARVWFDWQGGDEAEAGAGGALEAAMTGTGHRATVEADSTGRFLACGVALERPVVVEARGGSDTVTLTPGGRVATLALRSDPDAALEVAGRELTGGGTELVGTVRSKGTGEPLPGARLVLVDAGRTVTAEEEGRFLVSHLPPGEHRLVVEQLGNRTDTVRVTLEAGTTTVAELTAETDPVELAGLEVSVARTVRDAQLRGFYRRMESGLGRFASREQVDRHGILGAMRRMPNIQIRPCYQVTPPSQGGPGQAIPIAGCHQLLSADRGYGLGTRGGGEQRGQRCVPDIYLDSIRIGKGDDTGAGSALEAVLSLPENLVEGIEVHEPGTAPPQHAGTGAGCGVVLVWTRR